MIHLSLEHSGKCWLLFFLFLLSIFSAEHSLLEKEQTKHGWVRVWEHCKELPVTKCLNQVYWVFLPQKTQFDEYHIKASPQSDRRLWQHICSFLVPPSTNMIYFQLTTCRLFVSCTAADSSESDLRDFSLWQLSWWAASPGASKCRCGPHMARIFSWHAVKLTKFTEFRWLVLHNLSKNLTRLV